MGLSVDGADLLARTALRQYGVALGIDDDHAGIVADDHHRVRIPKTKRIRLERRVNTVGE